jgi:26S proteasome non-ATPase regulatory subunit 9
MEAVKTLIAQRDAIELEIESLHEWLQAPGRPGLKGGLVDKDGFPLEDVDLVIKTREARHRLACNAGSRSRASLTAFQVCRRTIPT